MKWFKRLDHWTDRQPVSALIIIGILCLAGMFLSFELESITARQSDASFMFGLVTGLLIGAALHVADLKRKSRHETKN